MADIACGSGHILLAAARRIATELAIVRTGEEQPSPGPYRAALRDVVRNCIYGVDYNPLAVELCKVALWLEAHVPGQPLNFLDHHIKCGNAIVGFVRREDVDKGVPDEAFATMPGDDKEIAAKWRKDNKRERADQKQMLLSPVMEKKLTGMLAHWNALAVLPERTPEQVEEKKSRFQKFAESEDALQISQVASIPIAQFYIPKRPGNDSALVSDGQFRRFWNDGLVPSGEGSAWAWATAMEKRFFHWFLEFPDVIARGGFDCILGNPPYLGGTDLSGTYGHPFCHHVKWAYAPTGLSDLVIYFLRRIFGLLKERGFTGLITTNSIRDGDIRADGLERVVDQGGEINMAVRSVRWPGRAKIIVSLVGVHKGLWKGPRNLDGRNVSVISPFLEDFKDQGAPFTLAENDGLLAEGSKWLGDGFILTPDVADKLIADDPLCVEVIRPILNGEEITDHPTQSAKRFTIYFADRSEEDARRFRPAFDHVVEFVKPDRDVHHEEAVRRKWWLFKRPTCALYKAIADKERCFAFSRHTKHWAVTAIPTDLLFSEALKVLMTDRWDMYAAFQSTLHEVWARKYSGAIKQDLRYSPSKCFTTYAFPESVRLAEDGELRSLGERYHEHRKALMLSLWLGLTDIYNLFHRRDLKPEHVTKVSKKTAEDAEAGYNGILELRRLHRELDLAVRDAYGWTDVDLGHDFHEVDTLPENDRVRYTISPAARKDILCRLLLLNHERATEEAGKQAPKPKRTRKMDKPSQDKKTLAMFASES